MQFNGIPIIYRDPFFLPTETSASHKIQRLQWDRNVQRPLAQKQNTHAGQNDSRPNLYLVESVGKE